MSNDELDNVMDELLERLKSISKTQSREEILNHLLVVAASFAFYDKNNLSLFCTKAERIYREVVEYIKDMMKNKCSECNKEKENYDLRPYGKDNALICYDCGTKVENLKRTEEQFKALIGDSNIILTDEGPKKL